MRETDFRDAEALLIRLSHQARPNREAALILERVKLYLADQFDRGAHPYVLPAEFAVAGKTTCRFFPREADTHPKHL
jgi:transposase